MADKYREMCYECGTFYHLSEFEECPKCNPLARRLDDDENILYIGPTDGDTMGRNYEPDFMNGPGNEMDAYIPEEDDETSVQISEEDLALLMADDDGMAAIIEHEVLETDLDQNGI